MKRRRSLWLVAGLVGLAWAAAVIPGSPAYLPTLLNSGGQYQGRSVSHWLKALDSPDVGTRREAVHAVGAIGPPAAAAVPRLAAILTDDPDRGARIEASLALSKLGPAGGGAAPAVRSRRSNSRMRPIVYAG